MFPYLSESGEGVHEYESTLRYLSSKSPLSERRLAIASLKSQSSYDISMFPYLSESGEGVHKYESHYVTSPLNQFPNMSHFYNLQRYEKNTTRTTRRNGLGYQINYVYLQIEPEYRPKDVRHTEKTVTEL